MAAGEGLVFEGILKRKEEIWDKGGRNLKGAKVVALAAVAISGHRRWPCQGGDGPPVAFK